MVDVGRVVKTIGAELGTIDILINNAAVMDNPGRFEEQQPERWQRDLNVNLTCAYNCSKAVRPVMVNKGWGRIISPPWQASWVQLCSPPTAPPRPV